MLKDERGFALPMVLIFATALTLLGITLLGVSLNQTVRTVQQEKREQAFYLAKSGADAIASHIIEHYNSDTLSQTAIDNLNNNYLKNIPLGSGTFDVKLTKKPTEEIEIKSTGVVGNVHNSTVLTLAMDASVPAFTHAILSGDTINTNGSVVIHNSGTSGGNVAAKNQINDTPPIHFSGAGAKDPNSVITFPSAIPFPDVTSWFILPFNGAVINNSGRYDSIAVDSSQTADIVVPDHNDMHIVFKDVKGLGTLTFNVSGAGTGIVNLYMDNIDLTSLIINNSGNKKVILHVSTSIKLAGSANLNGVLLFAPKVKNTIIKGSLTISKGAMVIGDITSSIASISILYDADYASLIPGAQNYKRLRWSSV